MAGFSGVVFLFSLVWCRPREAVVGLIPGLVKPQTSLLGS